MMSSEEDNQIELSGFPKEISIKIGLFVFFFNQSKYHRIY